MLADRKEMADYNKNRVWNKMIYADAMLNPNSNKQAHKKIKKDAAFYQKFTNFINQKFASNLKLDQVNAESLGLNSDDYKVVYTNFLGRYILEIKNKHDNLIINFAKPDEIGNFQFFFTNGNVRQDIRPLKNKLK